MYDNFNLLIFTRNKTFKSGFKISFERYGVDEKGFVIIDSKCSTNVENVWCIGDLSGEPMLAHRASAQGEMVAEIISGKNRIFDPVAIPAIVFTEPEIVCVGQSPSEAEENGIQIIKTKRKLDFV